MTVMLEAKAGGFRLMDLHTSTVFTSIAFIWLAFLYVYSSPCFSIDEYMLYDSYFPVDDVLVLG